MLLAPDHGLLFIHCPKCAGTSVKVALAAALGIDRPAILRAYGLAEHGTLAEARERLPAGLWKRLAVIGTMRDPLQRLASFWRFGRAAGPDGSRAFKGFGGENESAGPVPEIGPKVRAWAADVYARDYQRLGRHAQGSDRHRNG